MTQTITHSELVSLLCKDGRTIADEITGYEAHVLHMAIGIAGEAGELLDAIKKSVIYRKPMDYVNVNEELGDLEFYMEGLRQGLGLSRRGALEANIAKLTTRYHSLSYQDSHAQERADKQ